MVDLVKRRLSLEDKAKGVTAVQEKFNAAKITIVTEYRGLTVGQMTQLRREIRQASGEYHVFKNTLVGHAIKDTAYGSLDHLLKGPNGWVFGYEDPISVSKALVKFISENGKLTIKGGLLEGEFMDQAKVKVLAEMPSRPEIQAKLLALMQAPAVQLLRLVQEPGARVVRLLETLRKGKESQ